MSQTRAIVDKLLTNVSSMYVPAGYISEMLFPYIGVKQKTGKLGKYGASHIRIESSLASGRGAYRRVEPITRTSTSYDVEGHGLEGMVTEDDYDNVELPFQAESDEVLGLASQLWIEKEYTLAQALASTATLTQNVTLSGTSQFSDFANSDPIAKFIAARQAIKNGCGIFPDTAFMSKTVKNVLKFHPQLMDVIGFKYNGVGGLNDEQLALALDVSRVIVADVSYNSAKEGQADAYADCWGKHIWFGVLPKAAQVRQVSAGYRIGLTSRPPRRVTKYAVNNPPNAIGITCDDAYDYLLSNVGALYLIKDAIA